MAEDDSDSDKKNDNAHKHQVLAVDWRLIAASLSGCGFFMNNTDTHSLDLNKDGESSSLFKQKWSGMRLVDTVVLDDAGEVESWIFTAKTGEITAKKKFQDRAKVVERFTRFALANSSNTEGYVALVSSSSIRRQAHPGERTVVDRIALEEAMIGSEAVPPGFVGRTLQCYLRPQHGANSFLRGRVRAGDKSFSLMSLSPLFQRAPTASGCLVESNTPAETDSRRVEERDLGADGLHDQIKSALTSLAAFLEPRLCEAGADPTAIWDCEADFIVDDNGELWLTSLPNVTVSPKAAARVVESDTLALGTQSSINSAFPDRIGQRESDEDGADTVHRTLKTKQHMPPLTTAVADAADAAPTDGAATPLGTARTGTSEPSTALAVQILATDGRGESSTANSKSLKVSQVVLPEIPTMLGARSNRGEHNRSGDADERATPIIQKSGGVYLANVHASALRGLCCWREVRLLTLLG